MATNPTKIFGLWPQRGEIALGSYADIVVWDPDNELMLNAESLQMRVDYSPYEGRAVTGMPELVMARVRVIIEGDTYLGKLGDGEFIKRSGRII
jgi:dihydropyrimidinase